MIKIVYCTLVALFGARICPIWALIPLIGLVWYVWPSENDPKRTWVLVLGDLGHSPRIMNQVRIKIMPKNSFSGFITNQKWSKSYNVRILRVWPIESITKSCRIWRLENSSPQYDQAGLFAARPTSIHNQGRDQSSLSQLYNTLLYPYKDLHSNNLPFGHFQRSVTRNGEALHFAATKSTFNTHFIRRMASFNPQRHLPSRWLAQLWLGVP